MGENKRILVDGDACPVKGIILDIGTRYGVPIVIISSVAHFTANQDKRGEWLFVDSSYQNVDMVLVNKAKRHDVVVTQDYGLASLLLAKGCVVLHHKGFGYTEENIDRLLLSRHLEAKIRQGGGRTKGPKPFNEGDKMQFAHLLEKTLQAL